MKIEIHIGQSAIGGIPVDDPFITFICGESFTSIKLQKLKDWIDEIFNSNGNRNAKAYESKEKLEKFFSEIIHSAIRHNFLKEIK